MLDLWLVGDIGIRRLCWDCTVMDPRYEFGVAIDGEYGVDSVLGVLTILSLPSKSCPSLNDISMEWESDGASKAKTPCW